ncbi:MAG: ABC transporter permease [Dehalococcoidia bacterium]
MRKFLLRRLIFTLVSVVGATLIVFVLSRMAGDPMVLYADPEGYGMDAEQIAAIRSSLRLDEPLIIQYVYWFAGLARGDLGRSIVANRPVSQMLWERAGATAQLAIAAWLVATVVGIPLGVLSAVKRGTAWDYIGRTFALFGQATPTFWIGIMGILIFSVYLGWLPSALRGDGFRINHFILPTLTVSTAAMAGYLRITRSSMLEVLDSEFVKLARAKGVSRVKVIWKHTFRNALIQPITVSAILFANFITGITVAEVVFAWPGLGSLMLTAVWNNDFPVLTGTVLVFVVIYMALNFVADMLYVVVDPRIRYS